MTSAPLPENRPSIWRLGSLTKSKGFKASDWKDEVLRIQHLAEKLPRQHLFGIFQASDGSHSKPQGEKTRWQAEADYGASFAAALDKAIVAKKLPGVFKLPRGEEMYSCKGHTGFPGSVLQTVLPCPERSKYPDIHIYIYTCTYPNHIWNSSYRKHRC